MLFLLRLIKSFSLFSSFPFSFSFFSSYFFFFFFILFFLPFQSSYSAPRNHHRLIHNDPQSHAQSHSVEGKDYRGEQDLFLLGLQLYSQRAQEKIPNCEKYFKEVVSPAYGDLEIPGNDDDHWAFIRNEKEALKYLNQFSSEKKTHTDEDIIRIMSLSAKCSKENIKIISDFISSQMNRLNCGDLFPEYEFQMALVYALKNYPWSKSTKEKARRVLMESLKYNADHALCHLEVELTASVLEYLARTQQVDPSLGQEIKNLHDEVAPLIQEQQKRNKALQKDRPFDDLKLCEEFQKINYMDFQQMQQFQGRLKSILNKMTL